MNQFATNMLLITMLRIAEKEEDAVEDTESDDDDSDATP